MDGGRNRLESVDSILRRITGSSSEPEKKELPNLYVLVDSPENLPYMVKEHVPSRLHGHKIKARLEIGDYVLAAHAVSDTSDIDPDIVAMQAVDKLYAQAAAEGRDVSQAQLYIEKWTHRAYEGDASLSRTRNYLNKILQHKGLKSARIDALKHNREVVKNW